MRSRIYCGKNKILNFEVELARLDAIRKGE